MKIGHARVSTDDQNLSLQLDALKAAGCDLIHQDLGVSGATSKRDGLDKALADLGAGDTIMGALAEFERALIQERTRAGLDAAKRRGVKLGRRRKLSTSQIDHAREQIEEGAHSVPSKARLLGVGAETLRRALKA